MRIIKLGIVSIAAFLFTAPLAHAQWFPTSGPGAASGVVTSFAVSGSNLFAGTTTGGVFLTTNNGTTWKPVNTGLNNIFVSALTLTGTNTASPVLIAGTSGGVYVSIDNGTSWIADTIGLTNLGVVTLAVVGQNTGTPTLFAGTGGGIFRSTGANWTKVKTGVSVFGLATGGTSAAPKIFAATDGGGVYLSIDNGTTWSQVNTGLTDLYLRSLWVSGTNLFAGSSHFVFLSTNDGTSWTKASTGLPNTADIRAFEQFGTNLFSGNYSDGVYLSSNNGANWTVDTVGLKSRSVRALAVMSTNLFAGTGNGIVYRLAVGAGVSQNEQPVKFRLEQNYPNPFNPSTEITFVLTERGMVQLDIFDMLGRKIQSLVNGVMDAGQHRARFDAVHLPSGIYTASFTIKDGSREMKMILGK